MNPRLITDDEYGIFIEEEEKIPYIAIELTEEQCKLFAMNDEFRLQVYKTNGIHGFKIRNADGSISPNKIMFLLLPELKK